MSIHWKWPYFDYSALETRILMGCVTRRPTDYAYLKLGDDKINMLFLETVKTGWYSHQDELLFSLTLANYTRLANTQDGGIAWRCSMDYSENLEYRKTYGGAHILKVSSSRVKWYEPLEAVSLATEFPRPRNY